MAVTKAHELSSDKYRTDDIKINENVDFKGLLLSEPVLQGLTQAGFVRPSPIQLQAIPLGRCGLDLIVQAKSGTGKTCVFTVVALESISVQTPQVQVLVLAPTREIAVQIAQVIIAIGSSLPGLRCYAFIGGIQTSEDVQKLKRCHIAVGTPGRIKQLIDYGHLKTDSIRLFVLDEADKLLDENFQKPINCIYSSLPEHKQMMALSATYPEALAQLLTCYMQNPTFVRLSTVDTALLGVKQFYDIVPFHPLPHQAFDNKVTVLQHILNSVAFNQCLIFSNYQTKAQTLSELLVSHGWASVYISGSQDQLQRMQAMDTLQRFRCRILISTDLTARGIDVEHVNLVINMDMPWDTETYLHRIGRAGRYGTAGLAISIASAGKEEELLKKLRTEGGLVMNPLPKVLDNQIWKMGEDGQLTSSVDPANLNNGQTAGSKSAGDELEGMGKSVNTPVDKSSENNEQLSRMDTTCNAITKLTVRDKNRTVKEDVTNGDALVSFSGKPTTDIDNLNSPGKVETLDEPPLRSDVEFEKGFLSDVSKQLEGIQRQLMACTQQYHERVDPIRAETPKLNRKRLSRRNSQTELCQHSSSSDEDRGRPSVRKQKRKRSKSRKGSSSRKGSRRGSRSRRSSLGSDKAPDESEVLSSDSNVDESLAILAEQFNENEINEAAVPEEVAKSVMSEHPKERVEECGLHFKDIAEELELLVLEKKSDMDLHQPYTTGEALPSVNSVLEENATVHKCARSFLDSVVNQGCKMSVPDSVLLVDKYLRENRSMFHKRIRSLLKETKKEAKKQILTKKLQEVQNDELLKSEDLDTQQEDAENIDTSVVESAVSPTSEKGIDTLSIMHRPTRTQKLDLGLPETVDLPNQTSTSDVVQISECRDETLTAASLTKALAALKSCNQDRQLGLDDFVVSDNNSTDLAASSSDSDSEDDEAASGETSSDSECEKLTKGAQYTDVRASGDATNTYGRSNDGAPSKEYWNHHQIGDWEAYWKSYREWTSRAERPLVSEKATPSKQLPAVTPVSGSQCAHCHNAAAASWGYYYNPYYSWTSPSPCQVCQAVRWNQYYESQQASAAWWNYYWKYQQWQGYNVGQQQYPP